MLLRISSFLLLLGTLLSSTQVHAAQSLSAAQKMVDDLRTLAADKYEAANSANIRIRQLESEMNRLQQQESDIRKSVKASSETLAKMAVANYKGSGFGQGFELLFSSDPTQYLSDSAVLNIVSRDYNAKLKADKINRQRLQASALVVSDRTALLKAEKIQLEQEVQSAKIALAKAEKILASLKVEDRLRLNREESAREGKILADSKKYAAGFISDNSRGSTALKFALQQIGDIYVWAAAGPTKWDCSGLTMRSFEKSGVSLPHSAAMQFRYGKSISYENVKPGDLLFYGNPISHVSIYMGRGKMVQAPRPGKKVEVVEMVRRFGYKPFIGAKRL